MMKTIDTGALTAAYIGDAVYELLMRIKYENHNIVVKKVCAEAQSAAVDKIIEYLNDNELTFYKRGRNAKVNSVPQHASVRDYHRATGLEALFGYLYIDGKEERIKELFNIINND